MMIKFAQLTSDDLNRLGIATLSFSNSSVKAIDATNDEIIGYIVVENTPLRLPIKADDSNEVKEYKQDFNSHQTFYIKKISILQELRYSGNLETMFMNMTGKLPKASILWCKPSIWDCEGYIRQIEGFENLPYNIDNRILISSI